MEADCGAYEASNVRDRMGREVSALLQERHVELMRSIDQWLRREEEMVQHLFRTRGNTSTISGLDLPPNGDFGAVGEAGILSSSVASNGPCRSSEAKTSVKKCASGAGQQRIRFFAHTRRETLPPKQFRVTSNWHLGQPGSQPGSQLGIPDRLSDDEHRMRAVAKSRYAQAHHNLVEKEVEGPLQRWRSRVQELVRGPTFTFLVFGMILTNICLVGVETDYSAGGLGTPNTEGNDAFRYMHMAYTTLFAIELALRVIADGCSFWCQTHWQWNWFETFIVLLSVADCILASMEAGSTFKLGQNWVIRLFRVVRILRTLRIVRVVSFISEVCIVIQSITATLRSLVWAMVLMLMILYGFGIIITQAVSDYRLNSDLDDVTIEKHWSTLPRSILSLFEAVTGGADWWELVFPLSFISWGLVFIYLVFFIFTYFCLLNVMTAVFCQTAIENATSDREIASLHLLAKKQQWCEEMRGVFFDMDSKHSGVVDLEEFEQSLNDERMRAFLASREIDVHDAWTLFKLLDNDQRGVIEIENFVEGLLQLKGPAKAMQIAKVLHDGKVLRHQMEHLTDTVEDRLDRLLQELGVQPAARLRPQEKPSAKGPYINRFSDAFHNSCSSEEEQEKLTSTRLPTGRFSEGFHTGCSSEEERSPTAKPNASDYPQEDEDDPSMFKI